MCDEEQLLLFEIFSDAGLILLHAVLHNMVVQA